ncbi:MAG: LysR family transcriptional regulator [Oligoflexia bacterium]|nr:LysR family transcriptional regulator [Oligoflexia bacterium]
MYKINFNHLFYFLNITEEGSIVKAAKKLNISQPALSLQLKLLEEDLGQKLFERKGRKLIINEYGLKVKDYAQKIFRHSEEMLVTLKNDTPSLKIIKVGVVPWIPNEFVFDYLKPIILTKNVKVEVIQKDLDTLLKSISNKDLDLIICDSPYSGRSKRLQGYRIKTEKIYCMTSKKESYKGKFPQSLESQKYIGYPRDCMLADKLDFFYQKSGIQPTVAATFSNISLMTVGLLKSRYYGFLPESSAKRMIKDKLLYKLGILDNVKFSYWAITHKTKSPSDKGIIYQKLIQPLIKKKSS